MNDNNGTNPWADVSGPNMGYLLEQYDLYSMNPEFDSFFKCFF